MTIALPRPPRPMGFCAGTLDRLTEHRDDEALARALDDQSARFHLSQGGRWLCRGEEASPDPHFRLDEARTLGAEPEDAVLLGWTQDARSPRLALTVPAETELPAGIAALDLRTAGISRLFAPDVEGTLAHAQHFLNWHARARFCGACGAPTRSMIGGYRRDCTACGQPQFPRTDPVVIMLVHDGEGRCVLARQRHFAPGMWSCLAGFVEPGETIEDAVRREVAEEVGLAVRSVRYHSSQPWPFPGSLMIGCIAEATAGELTLQESELEAGRWFGPREVRGMVEGTHPEGLAAPNDFAIAHHLLRAHLDGISLEKPLTGG